MAKDVPVPTNGKTKRGPGGRWLPGHKPPAHPGVAPTRQITAAMLRKGEELVELVDPKTGKRVEVTRNEAMAGVLWHDALDAKNVPTKLHARSTLLARIDPVPPDEPQTLIPVNQQIYAPVAIQFLEELQERSGGHPGAKDVLDALAANVTVEWHKNGEAKTIGE